MTPRAWLPSPLPEAVGPGRERAGAVAGSGGVLHVDCDRCTVRGPACGECVISVLLGPPDEEDRPADRVTGPSGGGVPDVVVDRIDLNLDEQSALAALAGSGMVPPLRLVTSVAGPGHWSQADGADDRRDGSGDGWRDGQSPDVDGEADDVSDGWNEQWGGPTGAAGRHTMDEDWA